ncbi:MAG: MOSC domain-containing protein [Symploca sp. SIO3C6]|uniref:MOSC domain-containing protein n=1 Tax=Symploca sp. SIO1C4 TaxID=2607765 RepID=A0A6B3NIS5_9CYAN|nr:MOSC domain-containing protein [Symploca sp. SIO3C6]NER31640.1 MOSC domain-containing protein [Symploca sp. SIO1C4]NET07937.1 MOSC domain-containing protein [Symploca sp. SIO2B6]
MSVPYLANIFIYPIKSLDRISVPQATILESGALEHDREWALVDQKGFFVNGKRNAKIYLLRASFDNDLGTISLQMQGTEQKVTFEIEKEKTVLESWLSDYFGFRVKFLQNTTTGFPDDTKAKGPTVISTATIKAVASWFPELSTEEIRLRLRANLEIGGVEAFWEDQLFAQVGDCIQFQVGEVLLEGIYPCKRCVVPTRDSLTGITYPNFQKIFSAKRQETLPSWVNREYFNHFYRLSVNTKVSTSEAGKILCQGDKIKIIGATSTQH